MRSGSCAAAAYGGRLMPMAWGGHCYYVRKCEHEGEVGGIALPETAIERCQWVEVLGVGPAVGKRCSRAHAKTMKRPRWMEDGLRVGQRALCPNVHPGIKDSPLSDKEFFIEESVPEIAVD